MKNISAIVALLFPALLLLSCDLGKEPPASTRLLKVPGGGFTLGPPSRTAADQTKPYLQCGDASTPEAVDRCDSGKVAAGGCKQTAWIDDLTWVPNAKASVSDFQIEEHEVTNEQYAYCVEMEGCTKPAYDAFVWDGEQTDYYGEDAYLDHPVVNVTWAQARAYCKFVGRELPTEAQWERAARLGPPAKKDSTGAYEEPTDEKGNQWRTFPWAWNPWKGGSILWSTCNALSPPYAVSIRCQKLRPSRVGYTSTDFNELLGVMDMASNVSEWVLDGFKKYAYCTDLFQGYGQTCQCQGADECQTCKDDGAACARSCDENELVICKAGTWAHQTTGEDDYHVVRGGSYRHTRCWQRLYTRRRGKGASSLVGFRCAKP